MTTVQNFVRLNPFTFQAETPRSFVRFSSRIAFDVDQGDRHLVALTRAFHCCAIESTAHSTLGLSAVVSLRCRTLSNW